MGLFGKYVAYRWASSGPGGPSDDGGGEGVGLFLLIVGGIMAVVLLFGYILTGIGSLVYETVRPVLLVSPGTSVVVGGVLLGAIFLAIPKYPLDTAKRILTGESSNRDTIKFYLRQFVIVGILAGMIYYVTISSGQLPSVWIEQYTDNPLVHLVGNLAYSGAFVYTIYKLFHVPYRYHRLIRHAPFGTAYTIGTVFPVTASLMISFFDLPVELIDTSPSSTIGILFIAGLVSIPYVLPLVVIKLKAEQRILGPT